MWSHGTKRKKKFTFRCMRLILVSFYFTLWISDDEFELFKSVLVCNKNSIEFVRKREIYSVEKSSQKLCYVSVLCVIRKVNAMSLYLYYVVVVIIFWLKLKLELWNWLFPLLFFVFLFLRLWGAVYVLGRERKSKKKKKKSIFKQREKSESPFYMRWKAKAQ